MVKIDDDDIPAPIRKSVERACAKSASIPADDPVWTYLACVYREVMIWHDNTDEWHDDIEAFYKQHFHQRVTQSYFRILIELSAGPRVSPQEKSKYVTVLRYALDSKVKPSEFRKFLKKQGGIKGCIKASRAPRKKKTSSGKTPAK